MPEAPLTPERRRVEQALPPPQCRAPFVELGLVSCFSFLRGASDAVDLATTARSLGYDALGIADANSMAGVVRLHTEATALGLRPVIGCRIETVEGLEFLAYPADRAAYGRLCRLISAGRMSTLDGEWQDKGACQISLAMLAEHSAGVHLVLVPPGDLSAEFAIPVESNVVALDGGRWDNGSHEDTKARRCRSAPQAVSLASASSPSVAEEWQAAAPQTEPLRAFVSSCEPLCQRPPSNATTLLSTGTANSAERSPGGTSTRCTPALCSASMAKLI